MAKANYPIGIKPPPSPIIEKPKTSRKYGIRRELKAGDYIRPSTPPEKRMDVVHKVIAIKWGRILLYTPERAHEAPCKNPDHECLFEDIKKDCSRTHRCYDLHDVHLAGTPVPKLIGIIKLGK